MPQPHLHSFYRGASRQSTGAAPASVVQRSCACGGAKGPTGECAECRRKNTPGLQAKLTINQPGDRYEQEADRMADAVVNGGTGGQAALGQAPTMLSRQDTEEKKKEEEKPDPNAEAYKKAGEKTAEAFLETTPGKVITDKAKEMGAAAFSTLPGAIITGSIAVGAVAGMAATDTALPFQPPAIPLDILFPGLILKIAYEGPVNQPTKAALTFSGVLDPVEKKDEPSRAEKQRAANAKEAKAQYEFRESMKSDAQKAQEQKEYWDTYWRMRGKDPLNPFALPGLKTQQVSPDPQEQREEDTLQREATDGAHAGGTAPPIVHDVLRSGGQPLPENTRSFMERKFGHDFGAVRIHTDAQAARSANAVQAHAYTVGSDVVFASGQYAPGTSGGQRLLAHELTHVVQQGGSPTQVQREDGPSVSVRSPVFEETVTQASDVVGGLVGRPLSPPEESLATPIFGPSLDYARVRLITNNALQYRTVGNNIYIPDDFTIRDDYMAQTLVHELTHVWQYQHSGTSYISRSLGAQIVSAIGHGNRNFAYDYTVTAGASFFDYNPEQQGSIVESYFVMLRDQTAIPQHQAAGTPQMYRSNHLDADGFNEWITAADRLAEIAAELPLHEPLIAQMQASMPRVELDIVQQRAMEVMTMPGQDVFMTPPEQQLTPVRPLLRIDFNIPGL